jgi:arylsulfatase B
LTGKGNTGFWNVLVHQPGSYEIRLRRWPEEADAAIDAALPAGADVPGVKAYRTTPGKAIAPTKAVLMIGEETLEKGIEPGEKEVVFELDLPAGKTRMQALFESSEGSVHGAYYAYVERKE